MKNKRVKRIIYGLFVLIWMIVVFMFSGQNGNESQGTSDVVTEKIVDIVDTYFGITVKSLEAVSFLVRKCAHFATYFLGGILIYNFVETYPLKNRYLIVISIVCGIIYACFDEFHQYFVDGRAAQFRDVLIDTSGVIISIIMRNKLDRKYRINT